MGVVDLGFRALLHSSDDVSVEAATELLKQAEAGSSSLESLSPENHLLCAESAVRNGMVALGRSHLENFLRSRPTQNQFLIRAYFVLGRVQVRPGLVRVCGWGSVVLFSAPRLWPRFFRSVLW